MDASKYKDKYRIPSARAAWWDYGKNGKYFITICTKEREHFLGEVLEGKMFLSPVGVIADVLWHEIPKHFTEVRLGEFVVMPNHIHGILILDKDVESEAWNGGEKRFQNQGKDTVSAIVGAYKAAVSRHASRLGYGFAWQPRFHDHIIRNMESYQNIANYIASNPQNWQGDCYCK